MKKLKSLVLAKLGFFANSWNPEYLQVHSLLLEDLVKYIFAENESPVSLQRLCVHQFIFESDELRGPTNLWKTILQSSPMKSFDVGDNGRDFDVLWTSTDQITDSSELDSGLINPDTPKLQYEQLEHLAYLDPDCSDNPGPRLPKLKSANLSGNRFPVSSFFSFI